MRRGEAAPPASRQARPPGARTRRPRSFPSRDSVTRVRSSHRHDNFADFRCTVACMRHALPLLAAETAGAPVAPFVRLSTLWIQLTGTWCNLECTHCLNASGPTEPWLPPLNGETARRAIVDAERLGVKEIYFTGGEPFLHKDILALLRLSLAAAPTTALTNGTVITERMADALAALARAAI